MRNRVITTFVTSSQPPRPWKDVKKQFKEIEKYTRQLSAQAFFLQCNALQTPIGGILFKIWSILTLSSAFK
jgi:hypothetical protein